MDLRVTAGRYAETGARGTVDVLVQSLQLSSSEAHRRIALAKQVLPVVDTITGAVAPTAHQILAEAFFNGSLSLERAESVSHFLKEAGRLASNGRISEEKSVEVEEALVATGQLQGPDFIRSVGNQIMSHLDPDGNKPSESDLLARQGLFFRKPRRGLVSIYGACTVEQYEQLMAVISFATNPNKHTNIDTLATPEDGVNGSAGAGHQAGTSTASDTHTGSDTTTGFSGESGNSGNSECAGQESLLDQLHDISDLFTNTTTTSTDPPSSRESRTPDTAQSGPLHQGPPPQPPEVQQQAAPPSPEPDPYSDPEPTPEPEPDAETATETQTAPDPEPEPARPIPPPLINGWRRRIEPWEIPPRPPQAPENALPPVYDGDTWFWFGPTPPGTPAFAPQPMPKPKPTATATATATESEPRGEPGVHPGAPSPPPSPEPPPEQNYGFGPEWDSTPLTNTRGNSSYSGTSSSASASDSLNSHDDCDGAPEDDTDKPWPHSVYGVDVSAPGDNETLPGLDPIDPFSSDPAVKDTRTNGQKLLEGLISCVKLAARTGKLPLNGGLKTQLIISCTEEDLRRADGLGTAYTTYSGPMPLSLFSQSLCDPEITKITYRNGQEIINAGRSQRLFTPAQRKLLFARDLGCAFPDCRAAATWCEAHHVIPWQEGGETNLNNAALLCGAHHTLIHHSQWQANIIDGTPWFTPPWTLDPTQRKRRNNYHHGLQKNHR
ncbi:hypothetical protein AS189_16150 [Arthrobacter alpinus]|uniref:HNH nuclease domain-containing protein n=1 Tax=Arthrobacter alpinus TaxID=656366 RepID=A0A0S2M1Z2_9MICC|nr:hypothetical protein AS189_16150 [Arthrobacter alpinus]